MFKVSKNKKINEKLISNIIPFQNDLKFLINSSDYANQQFSSLTNNINQTNSYFNQIKETSFIISKEVTKEKKIKNEYLKKKKKISK